MLQQQGQRIGGLALKLGGQVGGPRVRERRHAEDERRRGEGDSQQARQERVPLGASRRPAREDPLEVAVPGNPAEDEQLLEAEIVAPVELPPLEEEALPNSETNTPGGQA